MSKKDHQYIGPYSAIMSQKNDHILPTKKPYYQYILPRTSKEPSPTVNPQPKVNESTSTYDNQVLPTDKPQIANDLEKKKFDQMDDDFNVDDDSQSSSSTTLTENSETIDVPNSIRHPKIVRKESISSTKDKKRKISSLSMDKTATFSTVFHPLPSSSLSERFMKVDQNLKILEQRMKLQNEGYTEDQMDTFIPLHHIPHSERFLKIEQNLKILEQRRKLLKDGYTEDQMDKIIPLIDVSFSERVLKIGQNLEILEQRKTLKEKGYTEDQLDRIIPLLDVSCPDDLFTQIEQNLEKLEQRSKLKEEGHTKKQIDRIIPLLGISCSERFLKIRQNLKILEQRSKLKEEGYTRDQMDTFIPFHNMKHET